MVFKKGHRIRNTGRTRFKKGFQPSEKTREKARETCIKRNKENNPVNNLKVRQKISKTLTGRKVSKETRLKQSLSQRGKKGSNWQGGKTKEQKSRMLVEYRLWRNSVFERDEYTCQDCKKVGGKLEAHHKKSFSKYPKLRLDINNGITLCKRCHDKIKKIKKNKNLLLK